MFSSFKKLNPIPMLLALFVLLCPSAYADELAESGTSALTSEEISSENVLVTVLDVCDSDEAPAVLDVQLYTNDTNDDDSACTGQEPSSGSGLGESTEQLQNSGAEVSYTLDNISLKRVDNQDYTGKSEINCAFTFEFTDNITGTVYEGYITGLQLSASSCDSVIADINSAESESVYRTDLKNTADKLITFYLRSHTFGESEYFTSISNDENNTGNWYDLIDAEKYTTMTGGSTGDGEPYGDVNLCWAAATSDILEYTGWSGDKTEDQVFTSFANKYFNKGFWASDGLKWYMNKVNPRESMNADNGDIVLQSSGNCGTNERSEATGDFSYGDTSYAAENYVTYYNRYSGAGSSDFCSAVTDALDGGDGIELSYEQAIGGRALSAHSVSVFGYIKETLKAGAEALKALFISDSDSDYCTYNDAVRDASESEQVRANQVNRYTLYYTELAEGPYGSDTYKLRTGAESPGNSVKLYISGMTVLENSNSTAGVDADQGTRDSVSSPDIVPQSITLYDANPSSGEDIYIEASFKNISYKSVCDTNYGPVLTYSILLYDENKVLISETQYSTEFMSFNAMSTVTDFRTMNISGSGVYYVGLRADSVGYLDWITGQNYVCDESYLGNNVLSTDKLVRIQVTGGKDDTPEIDNDCPISVDVIKTVSVQYTASSDEKLEIRFSVWGDPGRFIRLLSDDENEVSSDNYEITSNPDGSYTIVFTPEFLKSLPIGTNRFTFETTTGKTYILVDILIPVK